MDDVDELIKMDRLRRVPVSGTPVARARPDLVSRNVPNPEAQLGRDRGQVHTLFACPQPVVRTPQPQPVEQQTNDKDPLEPREARGCKDVPLVLLPQRRLAEPDGAVERQICLGDPPSLQLPPVKLWLRRFLWRGLDIAGRCSLKNLRGDFGRPLAQPTDGKKPAADNSLPELVVILTKYRRIRHRMKPGQNLRLSVRDTLRVDDQVSVVNRGPRWKRRDA